MSVTKINDHYSAATAVSDNLVDELNDYNLFATDQILQEILQAYGSSFAPSLFELGQQAGSAAYYRYAEQANRHDPTLHIFDPRGRRLDQIEFHPAWHQWMQLNRQHAVHAYPFQQQPDQQAWLTWATKFYLSGQVESGSLCPAAMTLGSIPVLQRESALWAKIGEKVLSTEYDDRDLPIAQKKSIWLGMGMTEKQGGSDVRSNQTFARPVAASGRGQAYLLTGHKWFFSALMCDAHLVVAQTEHEGLACFFVPRWQENGEKNPVQVLRLKDKVGNRSNSSSEVEFKDAWGVMIGEAGRGIPTIIEMANYTRLTCSVGSSAMLRQGLVQCLHYSHHRRAFGHALIEQPLMRTVLADLAIETEAAMRLAFHLAHCYDRTDAVAQAWKRIMTPAAKFWICKRSVEFSGEMMEVFGGNGYVNTGIMARIFKEAPVNSIWEGSGNVMCLDVLRAMQRDPEALATLLQSLTTYSHNHPILKQLQQQLQKELSQSDSTRLQMQARRLVSDLVQLCQAVLFIQYQAPQYMIDAFIHTRLSRHGHVVGAIDGDQLDIAAILARAAI